VATAAGRRRGVDLCPVVQDQHHQPTHRTQHQSVRQRACVYAIVGPSHRRHSAQQSPLASVAGALTTMDAIVDLSSAESKAGKLQRACLDLLKQHERARAIPTNGRFLFYELEQQGIIPKAYLDASGRKRARQPAQDVSDATMRLRELGLVPWWWILDESRDVSTRRYAASVYEYILDTVSLARIDCWGGELPPLVICEARATRG